jgi:hypothetical protein
MKKWLIGAVALTVLVGVTSPVAGHGGKKNTVPVYSTATADCGAPTVAAGAVPGTVADCGITYVDQVVTAYRAETRTRTVTECVPTTEEVMVNVTRYNAVTKQGMQTVTECVPTTEEYTVNVTRYNQVTKQGTRTRLETQTVTETVPMTETYVERVPYTYTVRVAVGGNQAGDACGGAIYAPVSGGRRGWFGCCK